MDGKLHIAAHARMWYTYMYIYVCCTFVTRRMHGRFRESPKKKEEMFVRKTRHRYARFVNDEENGSDSKVKGKKH